MIIPTADLAVSSSTTDFNQMSSTFSHSDGFDIQRDASNRIRIHSRDLSTCLPGPYQFCVDSSSELRGADLCTQHLYCYGVNKHNKHNIDKKA